MNGGHHSGPSRGEPGEGLGREAQSGGDTGARGRLQCVHEDHTVSSEEQCVVIQYDSLYDIITETSTSSTLQIMLYTLNFTTS